MDATPNEEWRPVVGYEGLYEVSDQGRVRSLDRTVRTSNGQMRRFRAGAKKPSVKPDGYYLISLNKNGSGYPHRLHAVVLAAFVGPRPPGMECLHINGDKADNRLSNLRYGTREENMQDQVRHGVHSNAKKTHCKWGHEFTPENTKVTPRGRQCRQCIKRTNDKHGRLTYTGAPRRKTINHNSRKTHCKHGHEFTEENTLRRPDGSRVCLECKRRRGREGDRRRRRAR